MVGVQSPHLPITRINYKVHSRTIYNSHIALVFWIIFDLLCIDDDDFVTMTCKKLNQLKTSNFFKVQIQNELRCVYSTHDALLISDSLGFLQLTSNRFHFAAKLQTAKTLSLSHALTFEAFTLRLRSADAITMTSLAFDLMVPLSKTAIASFPATVRYAFSFSSSFNLLSSAPMSSLFGSMCRYFPLNFIANSLFCSTQESSDFRLHLGFYLSSSVFILLTSPMVVQSLFLLIVSFFLLCCLVLNVTLNFRLNAKAGTS